MAGWVKVVAVLHRVGRVGAVCLLSGYLAFCSSLQFGGGVLVSAVRRYSDWA